jgi:hypothetical protein
MADLDNELLSIYLYFLHILRFGRSKSWLLTSAEICNLVNHFGNAGLPFLKICIRLFNATKLINLNSFS